jgi:hypothetical protein
MSLQLHHPDDKGELEAMPVAEPNWRGQLQSPRWGAFRRDGKLPRLANPEMNPTSTFMAVVFWLSLGALTFVVLVLGYGTGFWH